MKRLEKKFKAKADFSFKKNYNITPGTEVPIITSADVQKIVPSHFGFTPSFAAKKTYIINARAEGDLNKENISSFSGLKGIVNKPFFKRVIRSKRCIIPADAFIEGSKDKKLDEPYLVHLKDHDRPFAFAGVYDNWLDTETGEDFSSFAIITCAPNPLLKRINHHRMPVILKTEDVNEYLDLSTPISKVTDLLTLFPEEQMEAYKISRAIKNPKNNDKELLQPISEWEQDETKNNNQMSLFE